MQLATTLLVIGWFSLMGLSVVNLFLGAARPPFYFKGLGRLGSYRSIVSARPDPSRAGSAYSTHSCHYRILSPNEILFIGHQSFFTMPWFLKGRIQSDGTTWLVETYGSVTFWVYSFFFMVTLITMLLANYLSDGIRSAAVVLIVCAIALLFFRRWYMRQRARTELYADEIAMDLEDWNDSNE